MSGTHNQDDPPATPSSQSAKDGAGALPDDPKPVASRKIDAAVEMTFPGSDPASTTTQAGLRTETDALHQPITSSKALHRMVSAGLQAAYASENAMLARLQEANATSPALQESLDGLRAEGGRQLERLQRSLAVFGVSADRSVPGTAPPGLEAGPLGDLALAFGLRVEGHRALGTYEALEQVASSTGMTDVVQYMQESVAAKQQTLDELARLCGDGLIEAAVRAGGDALPDPVLHQVFGA